jgi:aspartyl-tRNA(Asn)/glutamyl-tRNA(Gln) amidotransferase subunit A
MVAAEPIRERLCDLDLVTVAGLIRRKEVSPVDVAADVLDRIDRIEPRLNAFITILRESARGQARQAEAEILRGGYRGPFHGIPLTVKDLFETAGVRTTGGSALFADHVPTRDATVVARLKEAGAVIVGKTNMLELAYAAVHPDFGPTRNPWDLTRSTSGSSTGSAAAVAAGMGYGSLGTDNAGSVRLPASYCGIVGLKPTYGRVSRAGVLPGSWTMDHVGPMTRTVADAAAILTAVAGADPRDPTSASVCVPDALAALDGVADLAGVRIGVDDAYLRQHVDGEVLGLVEEALRQMERLGVRVETVQLPPLEDMVAAAMAVITPEITAAHLPYLRECPEAYSPPVRERLELGLLTPAVAYLQAQRLRRALTEAVLRIMATVDLLVTPTTPTAATPIDEDVTTGDEADPALLAALIYFTAPFDLTGMPAISLPCGFTRRGLPVGLQLAAGPWQEIALLRAAHAYERSTEWHRFLPSVVAEA